MRRTNLDIPIFRHEINKDFRICNKTMHLLNLEILKEIDDQAAYLFSLYNLIILAIISLCNMQNCENEHGVGEVKE